MVTGLLSSVDGYVCRMAPDDIAREVPDVVYNFSHEQSAARGARRALAPIVDSGEFGEDVNLVASELVSNVVRHTDDGGRMDAWDDDPLRLEVHDTSPELPITDSSPAEGGRGLRIIDALSSDWGADRTSDGKVVWAEVDKPSD
jgi:anti-sigma regulatory factor (Ser/Thr protein kinase)